jgi:hypothetical protein
VEIVWLNVGLIIGNDWQSMETCDLYLCPVCRLFLTATQAEDAKCSFDNYLCMKTHRESK